MPVAEESGVKMALHPDDPPADMLRNTARLVNQPGKYQRVIDLVPSKANALEFCLGSLQEMREGDVLESIEHYGKQGKIAYVHFRNVRGKVPLLSGSVRRRRRPRHARAPSRRCATSDTTASSFPTTRRR